MKISRRQQEIIVILVILSMTLLVPGLCFSQGLNAKQKIAEQLTNEFRDDGFKDLTFEAPQAGIGDAILIRHGVIKTAPLTEGELVSSLGVILKPDVVKRLKNAGYKKVTYIDGNSRTYPAELSTKYYYKLRAFLKKLAGGK
ncbi:MAG: hypothetical protein A4E58_02087 [Syntrophorhabdus sp. PtaB.Bin006]|nr:MAG: hypothetical protein A4E58_02087 [Syntrophorhabdus sp. PtaB.Bin006]